MDNNLLTHRSQLTETVYFEFLPGKFRGQTFTDESVFLEDETFGLIEPIVEKRVTDFDRTAFTGIAKEVWELIIADMELFKQKLLKSSNVSEIKSDVRLINRTTEETLDKDFSKNKAELARMIDNLTAWLRTNLQANDMVSILGV
jgi:hypothetical protein